MRGGRPLVLSDPMLLVRRANERLLMIREQTTVASMPIREISHVAVHGPVTLTGAAIAGLLDEGIDVSLHSSGGRWRGLISSAASKNVYLLLAQADAWRDAEKRVAVVQAIVAGKVAGQGSLLKRHALDRGSLRCEDAAGRLRALEAQAWEERDLEALRGIEGAAGAAYFDVFGEMLGVGWRFPGRVRRPATDPVNALLSFGYTLATGEMARLLTLRGFDTRIGLLHGLRYGRESLALDMVEEFRAVMVDRFVLRVLNRGQFKVEDFEAHDDGGVRLTQAARRVFLELWEELLAKRATALRNEPVATAAEGVLLAKRIGRAGEGEDEEDGDEARPEDETDEGEEAPPVVTWRTRMERQVLRLHRCLMKGEAYAPITVSQKGISAGSGGAVGGGGGGAGGGGGRVGRGKGSQEGTGGGARKGEMP